MKNVHTRLSQYFFLHHYVAFVIQLSFVPEGAVREVVLSGRSVHSKLFCNGFVMSSSLVSASFRGFSFRIWHNFILTFLTFPIADRWHPLVLFLQLERSKPIVFHFLHSQISGATVSLERLPRLIHTYTDRHPN